MAHQGYMTIKGTKQGQFKGESIQGNRKDKWIEVLAFEYSLLSPRDAATGQASGKRQHQPIVITKEWGAASPQIQQALTTREILGEVDFQFARPSGDGKEVVYQTIHLTNAQITSFHTYTGALPPGPPSGKKHETLTLIYGDQLVTGGGGPSLTSGGIKRFGNWG